MKIVFFGTSSFSAKILQHLASLDHRIVAIVTRPDRPQGRDLKLKSCPVKEYAVKNLPGILLLQPEKASTQDFCDKLRDLQPDLFLVVAYGEILRQNVLQIPTKACVNIHTSLLPKLRGAAPIQRCLMQGDDISGVTFMEMALKMDAGDILKQDVVLVSEEMNVQELENALCLAAQESLAEFLFDFDDYYAHKRAQDEAFVTFAPKITAEDTVIDWTKSAKEIHNQIRALSPSPGVFISLRFGDAIKRLKILSSTFSLNGIQEPGKLLVDRNSFAISCKDGLLHPTTVQLEGKKAMKTEDFLRGVSKSFSLV